MQLLIFPIHKRVDILVSLSHKGGQRLELSLDFYISIAIRVKFVFCVKSPEKY